MDFMHIIILYAMKHFLDIDETPLTLERSFKVETKFRHELRTDMEVKHLPLMNL